MKNNNTIYIDRREFLKNAAIVSLASSLGFGTLGERGHKLLLAAQPASNASFVAQSPYGVCAHIGGGEEWEQAPQNLIMMKEAGISWVRADFSWTGVEYPEGKWHFDHLDKIVDETNKLGLQILPILDYDVPWATPAYKHMDAWLEYVKRTVERYKDRIQYWEIWNEENLQGFWRETPDGANYATLLKATYKLIKEIDPNLQVVYGGLAGVPVDFFEKTLDCGAGDFFDVVNIHPYRGGLTTDQRIDAFASEIDAFRQALKKRNLPDRPIWITEMGWATPPIFGECNRRVVTAAVKKLYPNKDPKVAFFYDDRYDPAHSRSKTDFLNYLPEKYLKDPTLSGFLNAEDVQKISNNEYDMLIMPPSEGFPSNCFEAAQNFVKNGGTLVLLGGVPLYYETQLEEESGRYVQVKDNPRFGEYHNALRISWYAWWTRDNVPETAPTVVAPDSADVMSGYNPVEHASRFFDDAKLKPGDKMISLLDGKNDTFTGSTACIYKFDSDYKGAVVINAILGADETGTNRSTVPNQAVYLSQAYLLAFANGIDRFFWYEFHAPERDQRDPEHHFGIVGQKLDPKPGYFAYKTLTKVLPSGSTDIKLVRKNGCCMVSWKRPDGKNAYALWSPRSEQQVEFSILGKVDEAFDYLNVEAAKPAGKTKLTLSYGVLYLIGPEKIEFI